ncbi:MAG: HAMP domain-containing protein [Spirochaetales bacterium]|nr:HAMP domain-containing protein [Spirochaetales bacterium]
MFSIRFKVVLTIILVLLATISISIFLTVSNQQSSLLSAMRNNLTVNNGILNTVIKNIMLSGEAPIANKTMSDLKAMQEFEEIEIYRIDGTVAFNDYSTVEAVNNFQDKIMFSETPRSELKMIDDPNFQKVLESNTPRYVELLDSREVEYFFPILNLPDCRTCHGTESFVRGVAHYKVSVDEIFEQINSSRNMLTVFFLITGSVISFILIWMMQRIVVKPVILLGSVVTQVGNGNLDIRTNIKSNDELGLLGTKLNEMISGLKEKRGLELENIEIETRNRENKKYLDNINEGLLLLNQDLTISKQYSRFVTVLFNQQQITGLKLSEFIYPDSDLFQEERKELDQFVKMVFEKIKTDMEMILSINPLFNKKIQVTDSEGNRSNIIIDAHFQRIFNKDKVENVMVIFEDRTKIINIELELEEARKKSQSELEQIAVILKAGPDSFLEFVQDAESNITESMSDLESINLPESLARILRNLHSLKGSARYMDLKLIADKVHETEGLIIDFGDRGSEPKNQVIISQRLEDINIELERIKDITRRFSSFGESSGIGHRSKIEQFFETLKNMVEKIAEELGKDVVLVTGSNIEDFPYLREMRDPVIHLIRNSIDHGVEDSFERLSAGKNKTASIKLEIGILQDGQYQVFLSDDGRGINFNSVRKSAIEKELIDDSEISNHQLAELLFSSSFSTRTKVSSISGRGVGLDVVSDVVKTLNGTISIATTQDKGTKFTIKLPAEKSDQLE